MAKKELVLIGAGKIGRGYIADLFNDAGYKLTFLEYSEALVQKLRAQGYYTCLLYTSMCWKSPRIPPSPRGWKLSSGAHCR